MYSKKNLHEYQQDIHVFVEINLVEQLGTAVPSCVSFPEAFKIKAVSKCTYCTIVSKKNYQEFITFVFQRIGVSLAFVWTEVELY